MIKDVDYTNGVVAVKENSLLKDKIFRLCEMSAEDAFRALTESGFGAGAEADSVYSYERLIAADERDLDAFIREYAPSETYAAYLLAPRDFHNAKALLKAVELEINAEAMLSPQGLIPVETIKESIESRKYDGLGAELGEAVKTARALFYDAVGNKINASGAEIGNVFEKALFKYLSRVCKGNRLLKKLVSAKADMTNILTALRSQTYEYAADNLVCGGKIKTEKFKLLFSDSAEKAESAAAGSDVSDFLKICIAEKSEGKPMTEGERIFDGFEADYLSERICDFKKAEPFLYYVFRRRAENANVRIVFACLLAGMRGAEIEKRLRAV